MSFKSNKEKVKPYLIMVIFMKENGIIMQYKATEYIQKIKIKPYTKESLRNGRSKEMEN